MRTLSALPALPACPPWCAARHDHTDNPADGVLHASAKTAIAGEHGRGLEVRAIAYVAPRVPVAPVVEVNKVVDGSAYECVDLTPAEALQLAGELIRYARLAMGDVPPVPGRVRSLAAGVAASACARFGGGQ